jgi:hypothetical protein
LDLKLQVEPKLAAALNTADHSLPGASDLMAVLSQANASLVPLDPSQSDPELSRYFNITVPDDGEIALRDKLLKTAGVTAAYISPAPELP